MRKHMMPSLVLAGCMLLTGCGTHSQAGATELSASATASVVDLSELFSDRDKEIGYDEETAVHIVLSDNGTSCDSAAVTVDGNTVTITDEGTYILSGTLSNGMIVVNAEDTDKIQLVLNGVNINSATSAAIYIPNADKVFVTTAADSVNVLKNGGEYVAIDDNNIDGVIFAKSDLTLNGSGNLQIEAATEHGIVTKDDLVVTSGTYDINVAGHGLSGKDSVAILDGTFTLNTGKDGIQGDNDEDSEKGYVYLAGGNYTITAQGDGVSASSWMQIDGGNYSVTTGGGSINGETHTDSMQPGGMGGGPRKPGTESDGQRPQMPEGTAPSAEVQPPQNMTPPDDAQRPEFTQPSTDTALEEQIATDTAEDTASTKGFKSATILTVVNGNFVLDCADDAFHSNGDLNYINGTAQISTGDDAFHADNSLIVENGTIDIITCYEGLEGLTVSIYDGIIHLVASDDGINAAGDVTIDSQDIYISITGGAITIDAGGDGLDSNGDLNISGGTIYVSSAQTGADTPLDYDGEASITGGILIGTGTSGMFQNFGDSSTQGSVVVAVDNQDADSNISICDETGNILATWDTPKSYNSVIISTPDLQKGNTYTVTAGSAQTEITLDELIYGGNTMQPGGMGGRGKNRNTQLEQEDTNTIA